MKQVAQQEAEAPFHHRKGRATEAGYHHLSRVGFRDCLQHPDGDRRQSGKTTKLEEAEDIAFQLQLSAMSPTCPQDRHIAPVVPVIISSHFHPTLSVTRPWRGLLEDSIRTPNFTHIPPTLSLTNSGLGSADSSVVGDKVRGLRWTHLSPPMCEEVEGNLYLVLYFENK